MQQVERTMRGDYLVDRDGILLAQREWAEMGLRARISVVRNLRRIIASGARELAETVPTSLPGALNRTAADTLVSEVLPLIEACRFLEREAARILRTRRLGSRGLPLWLSGVEARVERVPLGVVLVVGAANYPLFLAGVQTIQALVAGNAVLWKPAPGTETPAFALRALLIESGLNPELLTLLEADAGSVTGAIAAGVDHVVLTGSAETGKAVLRRLAETLTPATMELSGCDAVFVLPSADLEHTVRALVFGLRFNGSCTCMAPRRVFLVGMAEAEASRFETRLAAAARSLKGVPLTPGIKARLRELIADARAQGAEIALDGLSEFGESNAALVTLISRAAPSMLSMQAEIFAPVLSIMRAADMGEALAADAACPYALTAAIFGPESDARRLAGRLRVGNVLINDVVIPTADPRISFGGRGRSGFGVTRGAEGLLAMTTPRTIQVQSRRSKRPYEPTDEGHLELFAGFAELLHGGGFARRWDGLKRMVGAARKLK
jgi:acyl-CoA reductase-like NAD-dependent aldehyde dehydrogenase